MRNSEFQSERESFFGRIYRNRFVRWFVLLILLAAAGAAGGLFYFHHGLQQQEAQLRAEGFPESFADLGVPQLAAQENAATYYRAAAQALSPTYDQRAFPERLAPLHCPQGADTAESTQADSDLESLRISLLENATALALVAQAQAMPDCVFGAYEDAIADPMAAAVPLKDFELVRGLARTLRDAAVGHAVEGNRDEAFGAALAGLRLTNDLRHEHSMIGFVVRLAVAHLALESVQQCLARTGDPGAQRDLLLGELHILHDREAVVKMMQGELLFGRKMAAMQWANRTPGHNLLLTPFSYELTKSSRQFLTAVRNENPMARDRALDQVEADLQVRLPWKMMAQVVVPALRGPILQHDHVVAQVAAAELALTIEQYQLDHGMYPEKLEDVPVDHAREAWWPRFAYERRQDGWYLEGVGMRDEVKWCGRQHFRLNH